MEDVLKLLEDLFDKGYATREVVVLTDKLKAVLRTLSAVDQLDIESQMNKEKLKSNAAAFIIHTYSLLLLSKTIVSYGEKTFKNSSEAYSFLSNLTSSIVDKLVKAQNALEKDVRSALQMDSIETNFSGTGPLPEKLEQQPE